MHLDEKTPHIHASVVPIVQGERRQKKANKKEDTPKKQYRKKNPNRPRLCCDDVMARDKLTKYQDSYGEAMVKYGLQRGIKGSEARHITITEHYRNQKVESNNLQIDILLLLEQKETEQKALEQIKAKQKTEQLKKTVVDVSSTIMDGIGSMIGTSKVKKQQQEIDSLEADKQRLTQKIDELEQSKLKMKKEYKTNSNKLEEELKKIYNLFPKLKELLRIGSMCKHLGFSDELTKVILDMKPLRFSGKIYSSEYQRHFEAKKSVAEIKQHPTEKDKLLFTIDGVSDTNWFRQKYKEFQEKIGIKINEPRRQQRRMS